MALEGTLEADVGADAVAFAFTVENAGDEDRSLQFSDSQTFDVAVTAGGETVWRFAEGMMFAQMLSSETLAAGESVTYEAEWENPDPGEYEAEATLTATNADCTATTTFTV